MNRSKQFFFGLLVLSFFVPCYSMKFLTKIHKKRKTKTTLPIISEKEQQEIITINAILQELIDPQNLNYEQLETLISPLDSSSITAAAFGNGDTLVHFAALFNRSNMLHIFKTKKSTSMTNINFAGESPLTYAAYGNANTAVYMILMGITNKDISVITGNSLIDFCENTPNLQQNQKTLKQIQSVLLKENHAKKEQTTKLIQKRLDRAKKQNS